MPGNGATGARPDDTAEQTAAAPTRPREDRQARLAELRADPQLAPLWHDLPDRPVQASLTVLDRCGSWIKELDDLASRLRHVLYSELDDLADAGVPQARLARLARVSPETVSKRVRARRRDQPAAVDDDGEAPT